MDAYVARQPIFDKTKKVFAYELLFRDSMANFVPDIDGDRATTQLLSTSFFTMGFDRMIGDTKAFINFTRNLLVRQIPLMFPCEQTVVEILEDVEPDSAVIDACRTLREKNYTIALDDFINRPEMKPLVDLAHIIKIDFRAVPIEQMADYINPLIDDHVSLLAEKVETYDEFNQALDMGFEYFQGYFFCKPEIVRGKEISSSQLTILEIMAEVNRKEIQFDAIKAIIERDVAISYKLLHYINSAFYKRVNEINSIKQALVMLGESEIRRFVSMITLARLVSDKPGELVGTSFTRAKFLESLGDKFTLSSEPSELFTLGLFSLIDAILDQSMEETMDKLPLSKPIVDALVHGTGMLSNFLKLVVNYEMGNWAEVSHATAALGIDEEKVPLIYVEACQWGDALSKI